MEDILKSISTITEIGVGFGRTAQAIIKNFNNISNYTIVDLEPCLILSSRYLKEVLTKNEFKKITFLKYNDADEVNQTGLVINIDSFAEMDPGICFNYLQLIDKRAEYFYSRNPVCKYTPESIGLDSVNTVEFQNVLNVGLCREIINIFDEEILNIKRKESELLYLPSQNWSLAKSEISYPWQYYQHILYKKNKL